MTVQPLPLAATRHLPNRFGLTWNERMDPPAEEELAWFDGPLTYVYRRCDIFQADGTLWKENVGYVDGKVSVDMSRDERRTLDITLDNTDGSLDVHPTDGIWYDKFLKVWRGVVVGDDIYAWRLGEFMIDSISEDSVGGVIGVSGRDFSKKMMKSKLVDTTTFASGTDISVIIKALATNSGITKLLCPPTGVVTGKDFTFDRGTSRWEAAKAIADDYGYELFFNAHGYLTLRTYTDPLTSPVALTFDAGILGNGIPDNVISWNRKINDGRLYNHIVVIGEATANTTQIFAEAENTEPTSPTSIARLGRRTYHYVSKFITSTPQAQATADRLLAIHALEQFDISIESSTYPWLDAASTIRILTDSQYAPERYLLQSLEIPLGLASMTASAGRVTIVG